MTYNQWIKDQAQAIEPEIWRAVREGRTDVAVYAIPGDGERGLCNRASATVRCRALPWRWRPSLRRANVRVRIALVVCLPQFPFLRSLTRAAVAHE